MSWFGRHTIINDEDGSRYMTRWWIGRLRLHIFHRPDLDPDPHDHPWDFWTFPLTSYVEEVLLPNRYAGGEEYERHLQVVRAWRWHFRPAEHTHRVLGRALNAYFYGDLYGIPGRIVTIVWRGPDRRLWGFFKHRNGRWCWQRWREYRNGGRNAPCRDVK